MLTLRKHHQILIFKLINELPTTLAPSTATFKCIHVVADTPSSMWASRTHAPADAITSNILDESANGSKPNSLKKYTMPPNASTTDAIKSTTSASLTKCSAHGELLRMIGCACSRVSNSVIAKPEKSNGPNKPHWKLQPTVMLNVAQHAKPMRSASIAFKCTIVALDAKSKDSD